jgi:hypothetical protein
VTARRNAAALRRALERRACRSMVDHAFVASIAHDGPALVEGIADGELV